VSTRDRTILGVICLIAAVVAPWLLVISPKRAQATKLQSQISNVQSQLSSVRGQLAQGEAARAHFASSYNTMVRLGEAVPTDDNTPSLIYELQSAAQKSRIAFQGLTFTPGPSTSSSSAGGAAGASLPPGVTVGPAGFPVEPFTFTFGGSFFHLADFLGRLQSFVTATNKKVSVSGRLMALNAITLAPGSNGLSGITATINATTYLLPASEGLLNGATPTGPAASTTQTVASSGPASSVPPTAAISPVR
jgi:type II secretory pathway pseudopilin PulG